jgi:molybdopterin-guanine dinucleotide biosynthesis protein MobB
MSPKLNNNVTPIITIVGKSGSGKTTLIEKLLPELKQRGYRVGTVKHHLHPFEIDYPGKDSWRYAQAGADTVIISAPSKLALIKQVQAEQSPDQLHTAFLNDVDVILLEGYKTHPYPKVEVFRAAVSPRPLCTVADHLVALVSDDLVNTNLPCFGLEEITALTDFLEQNFLRR